MLHVAATWAHVQILNFLVSGPHMRKDSTMQVEMLARSLDDVLHGTKSLPSGFALQQDNTYIEPVPLGSFTALGIVLHIFRWSLSNYLKPGHSHEDSLFT